MTIGLGLIGAGSIGKRHVQAAKDCGVPFRGIVDVEPSRAQELAESCNARSFTHARELLADPDIAAVVICVPNYLHKPLAIEALMAGKDVLLEKPMGLTADECREINRVAQDQGRVLQIGLVHRYTAVGRAARSIAESGQLGQVYHAKASLLLRRNVPGLGGWFTTKTLAGGGALIDLGVHLLDLALHVLGFPQPREIHGQVYSKFGCRMRDYVYEAMWAGPPNYDGVCDVEDAAHAWIRFDRGLTLELNVSWAGNFPDGTLPESLMGFYGDQAGMSFALFADHLLLAHEQRGRNVDTRVKLPTVDAFQEQMQDFLQAVRTRQVRGATGEEVQSVQQIIDAIYRSSQPS